MNSAQSSSLKDWIPAGHRPSGNGAETKGVAELPAARMTATHYKRVLKRRESLGAGLEGLEGAGDGEPDLSEAAIRDRAERTTAELHRIVKDLLGDKPDLHEVVELIAKEGRDSLQILANEDRATPGLEVIVRTDGSRPSFMVRNGEVDKSPARWERGRTNWMPARQRGC